MKKITILALHLNFGGVEKYISSLCKMLEEDYQIEIISTYKILEKPAFEFSDKIKITYLINDKPYKQEFSDAIKNKKIISAIKYLFKNIYILILKHLKNIKAIKNIDSDIIITTRSFHNKLVGKYAKKDIVKIATEHNYHNNNNKYINNLVKSLKNFDYLIVVSKELQKFYQDKIGNTRCIYIPNVIDKIYDKPKYNTNHNLISVGRLEHEKGFSDLIDIIDMVRKKIPDIKLNLIGDGSLKEELSNKIKNLNLNDNIIMHGFLNHEKIEKIMLESSLYVMSSLSESFGLVLIEAMSYGVPCIAFSSASGAKEVIENKELLIENRDKDDYANLVIRLINDKEKLIKEGKESYKDCQKYLINNVKNKWLNLLNDIDK